MATHLPFFSHRESLRIIDLVFLSLATLAELMYFTYLLFFFSERPEERSATTLASLCGATNMIDLA
jgi:hypothetical protein